MRLVKVAKALGMTGQELRHELEQVNFGVKPTDREVPDNLAQGILRYIASKRGIKVDFDSFEVGGETGFACEQGKEAVQAESGEAGKEAEATDVTHAEGVRKGPLKVLRKLTLEDVTQEAVDRHEKLDPTILKQEKEEQKIVEKARGVPGKKKIRTEESVQEQIKRKEGVVLIPGQISVKEFAEKAGVQVPKVIGTLMKNGVMATINQTIDFDTAAIVASDLGVEVRKEEMVASAQDILSRNLEELLRDEPERLSPRPPVVVVMGHVDHGKTSILDAIRKTEVAAGEAGGITQHIGAYQVRHAPHGSNESHAITFLDTPGHEAFTSMRARGAKVTDIAIIVVAADEGVKPTTIEAINHAKEAGVPIIAAINKIDKEGADLNRVQGELSAAGLQPEEWGGKTVVVKCSAKSGQGISDLLDSIVLVAGMSEFKGNADRLAVATVIESHLDPSLGPLATVIVNTGTLRNADAFVCGGTAGKVRTMTDSHGGRAAAVPPSGAVRVSGFDSMPAVGDILQVVPSEHQARDLSQAVKEERMKKKKRSFVDLVSRLTEGKLTQLKVVLKADAEGSLEAIKDALMRQEGGGVSVKVIHDAIGSVSESDVMMASASGGVVIAFNVSVPSVVAKTAMREGVEIREYDVVYRLLDEIDALRKGLIEPEEEEKAMGHMDIKAVFFTRKSEQIIGGKVTDGIIKRFQFRVIRDGIEAGTGRITSIKHGDNDIKEAKEGSECGLKVDSSVPIQEGDRLEVFVRELKKKA